MDLNECCMSTDVGTWTNLLIFEPDTDAATGLLSPLLYKRYRRNFTSGKSHVCVLERPDAAATRGFKMVLFTHRSKYHCRCKCAPPCALLGLFIVHCSHLSELCEAQYSVLLQWIESLQSIHFLLILSPFCPVS